MTKQTFKTVWSCFVAVLLGITLCAMLGCSSVLVEEPPTPAPPLVLNPEIDQTVKAAVGIWCRNLPNLRRIALRFIHALDPQWSSICDRQQE